MGGVLIVTWLGGGATQPAIGLGRELSARGHRVRISHGGMGSLLEAFRAGVPSVCVPLGRDQAENAAAADEVEQVAPCPGPRNLPRARGPLTPPSPLALRDGRGQRPARPGRTSGMTGPPG